MEQVRQLDQDVAALEAAVAALREQLQRRTAAPEQPRRVDDYLRAYA